MLALSFARDHLLGLSGLFNFSDISPVLTAGAFLMGFMLSGVMSDYKESERLSIELACQLETLEDHCAFCNVRTTTLTMAEMRGRVLALADAAHAFLASKGPIGAVLENMENIRVIAHVTERDGSSGGWSCVLEGARA